VDAMANKHSKRPDRHHSITIVHNPSRVIVRVAGKVIADTTAALTFHEDGERPVHYIPRSDVNMAFLQQTSRVTYSSSKGQAIWFAVPLGGARAIHAAWSYDSPLPSVAGIQGHIAFDRDGVDCIEEWEQTQSRVW
jgi:uncharacterized protein (DUF427 family)